MKKINVLFIAISLSFSAFSQDFEDVLRYSESNQLGNARYSAMGGAFGSLGANISALSINPAGSAIARGNYFEFSPGFTFTKSENYYLNNYDRAFTTSMKIPNLGIMFSKNVNKNDLFITGVAFGISVNRQNLYNQNTVYNATNKNNSITDEFLRLADNNLWYSDFNSLAFNTYLIGENADSTYFTDYRWNDNGVLKTDYGQDQSIGITKSGSKKEYLCNFAVDFSQRVFIGADLAVESIYYTENFTLTETDNALTKPYLNSFTYSKNKEVSGTGVSGKFGVIIKPIEYIRLGFSAHSPEVYSLNEVTKTNIDAYFDQPINNLTEASASHTNEFDYQVVKPAKFVTSLGFVFKNIAIIGVDYETIDYSYGYLNSNTYNLTSQNNTVENNLTKVDNLKVGAELRYGPFSFRGGVATFGNPYVKYVSVDPIIRTDISGGVGMSNDKFYCDLAWVRSNKKDYNLLYTDYANNDVAAKSNIKTDNIMMTVGFKF